MRRTPTPLSVLGCAALALGAPNAGAQCVLFVQFHLDSFAPASAQRLGALACPADLDLNCAVGVSDDTTFLAGFAAELPWATPPRPSACMTSEMSWPSSQTSH